MRLSSEVELGRVTRGSVCAVVLFLAATAFASAQQPNLNEFKNNLAPYVVTPPRAIDKMLEMANLKPGETLYDLGCGTGEILVTAAKRYGVKAVGVEISEHLAKEAVQNAREAGVANRVKVIHQDFMRTDLSDANVVTLYLATDANDTLRPNLERFLKPHSRVVSYDYPIPGWKPIDTEEHLGHSGVTHQIYLYEVPDSIKK